MIAKLIAALVLTTAFTAGCGRSNGAGSTDTRPIVGGTATIPLDMPEFEPDGQPLLTVDSSSGSLGLCGRQLSNAAFAKYCGQVGTPSTDGYGHVFEGVSNYDTQYTIATSTANRLLGLAFGKLSENARVIAYFLAEKLDDGRIRVIDIVDRPDQPSYYSGCGADSIVTILDMDGGVIVNYDVEAMVLSRTNYTTECPY